MKKIYKPMLAGLAAFLLSPPAFSQDLVAYTATFNFSSFEGMEQLIPNLPSSNEWAKVGSTTSLAYSIGGKNIVDNGVTFLGNNNSIMGLASQSRFNLYNDIYDFRTGEGTSFSISAPEGGFIESIDFTGPTAAGLTNFVLADGQEGVYTVDSDALSASWVPSAGENISKVNFSAKGNSRIFTIVVKGKAPEGTVVPDEPQTGTGTTTIQPTIDPPVGTWPEGQWWPTSIVIEWDGQKVACNPNDPNYTYVDDEDITGQPLITRMGIKNIPLLVNGYPVFDDFGDEAKLTAMTVYYYQDAYSEYWENADSNNPGYAIQMQSFPGFYSAPSKGDTFEFTIPANSFLIGENGEYNEAVVVKYTVGEVEYDDSTVKTYGSEVTFEGPDSCAFKTNEPDMATLAILTDSETDIADQISMVYKVDPNNPQYDKTYNFNTILGPDGFYCYNFEQVTYNEMVFTYTGSETVTFTFRKELVEGEQVGGLKDGGQISLDVPFKAGPESGQRFLLTVTEEVSSDCYIRISTTDNLLNLGTLDLVNSGDLSILGSWKSGTTYKQILGPNGESGYNGRLTLQPDQKYYVVYTGTSEINITVGQGVYTELGLAEYMGTAEQTPLEISVNDTNAVIYLDWGETVEIADADYTFTYKVNGEPSGAVLEAAQYLEFYSDLSGEPDSGISTLSVENGQSGRYLGLLFGAALQGDFEVGTYEFTLPAGLVKNAKGEFNQDQPVIVTVTNTVAGTVSPEAGYTFEIGEPAQFTISFEATPVIQQGEDEPVFLTDYKMENSVEKRINWADDVVYIDGNDVVINFGTELEEGTYYFSFSEGAVSVNGQTNEGVFDYMFQVGEAQEPATNTLEAADAIITPNPKDDSVEPFNKVTVSWEGFTLALNPECETNATFEGVEVEATIEDGELVFEVNAEEDGTYSLIIPEGFVTATTEEGEVYTNELVQAVFVVETTDNGDNEGDGGDNGGDNGDDEGDGDDEPGNTPGGDDNNGGNDQPGNTPGGDDEPGTSGIAGVEADANGLYKVYSINGVNVMTTNDAKALKNLKGLFIINGKKAVIK